MNHESKTRKHCRHGLNGLSLSRLAAENFAPCVSSTVRATDIDDRKGCEAGDKDMIIVGTAPGTRIGGHTHLLVVGRHRS